MGGVDGANCQAMCHFPEMKTNDGVVDVWHWKAARSNPMGISEDKFWDEAHERGWRELWVTLKAWVEEGRSVSG